MKNYSPISPKTGEQEPNTFKKLDKSLSKFRQQILNIEIYFQNWDNTFLNLDKYICETGQIYLEILTNRL